MPRIRDAREDSGWVIAPRRLVFVVASAVAVWLLYVAGNLLGDPTSAFARYRSPPVMPHVFVTGTIDHQEAADTSLPPLCVVEHERFTSCGKNRCWKPIERFSYSAARVVIAESSAPLPSTMDLSPDFVFEPWAPRKNGTNSARMRQWKTLAQHAPTVRFVDDSFHGVEDRLVETCVARDKPVFLEACVSPDHPGLLAPCRGQEAYGVIANGDAQAALDDAADDVARYVGGAAAALLVAALAWLKKRRPIVGGLEDRADRPKTLGWVWALLAVPPVLGLASLLMHALQPPSTWSTGRGGFAFALSMLTLWLLFAIERSFRRRRTLLALGPVLSTPRSLLAEANGTVELAVKARGDDLRSFIDDEPIAFGRIVVTERYRRGQNSTSTREVYRGRLRDHLTVVDESGEGRLDLSNSILEVEERTTEMETLSPPLVERGILVTPHAKHLSYTIREWIIRDGEPLYVFGDVSDIALRASEGGYRAVRGAPTLGSGKDAAPVLVHAGDERGLIALLTREARDANSYAVVAGCMCAAIAAALIALARL